MTAAQGGALPTARVSADGARALRHLRPWVWRKDVLEAPAAPGGWVVAVVRDVLDRAADGYRLSVPELARLALVLRDIQVRDAAIEATT